MSANSPCLGRGSYAVVTGLDIDGEPWANPPAIGCDEFYSGSVTGALTATMRASFTNVAPGFSVEFQALNSGRVSASRWEFDDGTVLSNRPSASRAWSAAGDYPVVLRAYNESYPAGVTASVTVRVVNTVHYVALSNASPAAPYTSWVTAATNIQDAVDAASVPGALVLVSNGVYQTGGRTAYDGTTNRVAVDKLLTVRSVNGPQFTIIQGYQVPLALGGPNGDNAIRCVYLTNGATLSGFTLTNGATGCCGGVGGGLVCPDSTLAVATNCLIVGNSPSTYGGGAYFGTLIRCTLTGNSSASSGGGAVFSRLNSCVVRSNSAFYGGGVTAGTLNNCTVTGNSASQMGGGSDEGQITNSIVYYNTAPLGANLHGGNVNYSCTTPMPADGIGNITGEPQLASLSHLSSTSPCRGAGNAAYTSGPDVDGEVWANPPSIGCDEYHVGAVTGSLTVEIIAPGLRTVVPGHVMEFTGLIGGRTAASAWDFGDGVVTSNRPYASHAWATPGNFAVVLRAYNESNPAGVSATVLVQVVQQPIHYVSAGSANPVPPYTSWAAAANNIQDAVDAAPVVGGGAIVLVTNGIYATGGRMVAGGTSNRVAVTKAVIVRSVNGPEFTVIRGYQMPGTTNGGQAIRCVYLADGARLAGFTLTNGATKVDEFGGGVFGQSPNAVIATTNAVVANCVLVGNSAT